MKKSIYLISLIAFITLIIFTGCEKKEEEPDKTALLTNHAWNIVAFNMAFPVLN